MKKKSANETERRKFTVRSRFKTLTDVYSALNHIKKIQRSTAIIQNR